MANELRATKGPYLARPVNEGVEWEVVKTNPSEDDPWFIALAYDCADGATSEANAHLLASSWELYGALEKAALKFREYEKMHRAKVVSPVPADSPAIARQNAEANIKADRNAEMAAELEAALAKARGEQ